MNLPIHTLMELNSSSFDTVKYYDIGPTIPWLSNNTQSISNGGKNLSFSRKVSKM